ncbi:MAG TPA: ribonuclease III [Geobacteraceae bacterium]|nr:ribonuclease III [Geobacteraceae bacterium]
MASVINNHFFELENVLGYRFANRGYLLEALTHKSFVHESGEKGDRDNQRLEFFGDAVIGFFVSAMLLERYPDVREGRLSKIRASLVNEKTLAHLAGGIMLGRYLRLGKGEEKTGGREKDSVLADAYEALIAAVYLDGGADAVGRLVESHFGPLMMQSADILGGRDYKTQLQEAVQEMCGKPPVYSLESESGPPHDRVFSVRVSTGGKPLGEGTGKSKKEAEQAAAREALAGLSMKKTAESA